MSLRLANWSREASPTYFSPPPVSHNRMAISSLLAPSPTVPFQNFPPEGTWRPASPLNSTEDGPASSLSTPPQSNSEDSSGGSGSELSGPLRRSVRRCAYKEIEDALKDVPRRSRVRLRSIPTTAQTSRFGRLIKGRYYCTWLDPTTNAPCASETGFTSWSDLIRHADSHHAEEEMHQLRQGELKFGNTQYIHSLEQLDAFASIVDHMSCNGCGLKFKSNRVDSKMRHLRNGACLRKQERKKRLAALGVPEL